MRQSVLVKLLLDVSMTVLYLLLMFAKELGEFFDEVVGIVTGVLIARELFTIDTGLPWMMLFSLHNTLSYVCLGAMALHLLLHAGYLVGVYRKLPKTSGVELRAALSRFFAGAAAALPVYAALVALRPAEPEPVVVETVTPSPKPAIVTPAPGAKCRRSGPRRNTTRPTANKLPR